MPLTPDIKRRLGLLDQDPAQQPTPTTVVTPAAPSSFKQIIDDYEQQLANPPSLPDIVQTYEEGLAQEEAADRGFLGEMIAAGKRGVAQTWGEVYVPTVKTFGEKLQSPGLEEGPIEQWATTPWLRSSPIDHLTT